MNVEKLYPIGLFRITNTFNFILKMHQVRPLRYVRKNFDWQSYIEEHYDVKYSTNGELRINCPSCTDRKYKFYVNPNKKVFHCFKCDFSTKKRYKDVFDFVALTENMGRGSAILKLLKEYRPVTPDNIDDAVSGALDEIPEQPVKFKHPYLVGMPDVSIPIQDADNVDDFWEYLENVRGLTTAEIVYTLQARVVPDQSHPVYGHNGKLKGDIGRRILWPLYGGDHKLVSWQARSFEKTDNVKYFNAPDTDISATLWPYVPPHKGSTVVLCEGVLDCVALRRLGREYSAYACFSKHITNEQIALLHQHWGVEKVILFWDQDAKRSMKNASKILQTYFQTFVPDFTGWPVDADCGSCLTLENGLELMKSATTNAVSVTSVDIVTWELF